MGLAKESPLMTIWDGNRLVGLHIHCPTAACHQPDRLEEELVRIFNEHTKLEAENKRLKCLCDRWAHMIDPHTDPGGCANCFHREFLQTTKENQDDTE